MVFHRKRLEPRVLPWQQYSRCHFVSFVMYISDAKFEDHCSNSSGDILYSVFYHFSRSIYDTITFLICIIEKMRISLKRKNINRKRHYSLLWKAFQISSNNFLLHRHFKTLLKTSSKYRIKYSFVRLLLAKGLSVKTFWPCHNWSPYKT